MSKRRSNYKNADQRQTSGLTAQNNKQRSYISAIKHYEMCFGLGPAGTGKTYIAATIAADMFTRKQIDKIIITRPNVASGRPLGFRPGDLNEKMIEWLQPVLTTLRKHLGANTVQNAVSSGNIEFAPLETMRGRSFEDAFIILDEAQNVNHDEIKMFLTRIGDGCKTVISGDVQQSDLTSANGLGIAIDLADKHDIDVPVIEFGVNDIVRSDLCKAWIKAFMNEDKRNKR